MRNTFVERLRHGCDLTDDDESRLLEAVAEPVSVGVQEVLIREGADPQFVHVVLDGFACRYKRLEDGTRQIIGYLLPGDMCDLHVSILGEIDHTIGTLQPCSIARLAAQTVEDLVDRSPRIRRALWWATLVDVSTCREWITSMGRRPADRQLAHLLCELLFRYQAVGLATDNSYNLFLTQTEFSDTLGMSTVHANRSFKLLREDGYIRVNSKVITITNLEGLMKFSGFSPNYLHLRKQEKSKPN